MSLTQGRLMGAFGNVHIRPTTSFIKRGRNRARKFTTNRQKYHFQRQRVRTFNDYLRFNTDLEISFVRPSRYPKRHKGERPQLPQAQPLRLPQQRELRQQPTTRRLKRPLQQPNLSPHTQQPIMPTRIRRKTIQLRLRRPQNAQQLPRRTTLLTQPQYQ